MTKSKNLFKKRSIGKIKKLNIHRIGKKNILSKRFLKKVAKVIYESTFNDAIIIERDILPHKEEYVNSKTGEIDSNKFMNHTPNLKLPRYSSFSSLKKKLGNSDETILTTSQNIKRLYDNLDTKTHFFYSGYTFRPFYGTPNKTIRKISLTEILKGTVIYLTNNLADAKTKPYDSAKIVKKEGTQLTVSIKSRSNDKLLSVKLISVPIENNIQKWPISYGLLSEHDCEFKKYRNLTYKKENSLGTSYIYNFCAHEIAAYIFAAEHYYNEENNIIPYLFRPFEIPNQNALDLFSKFRNNVLIRKVENESDKITKDTYRHLYDAEMEILFNANIADISFDNLFRHNKGVKIRDYVWQSIE